MENLVYGFVTATATVLGGMWVASRPRTWLTTPRLAAMVAIGGGILLATLLFEMLPEALAHGGPNVFWWLFAGMATVVTVEHYLAPRLDALIRRQPAHDHAHDHHDHHHHHHDHGHAHPVAPVHNHDEAAHAATATLVRPEVHEHGPGCAHDHDHDHGHAHDAHLISHGAACSAIGCLLVCTFFDGIALTAGFSLGVTTGVVLGVGLFLHLLPEGIVAASLLLSAGSSASIARRAALAIGIALMAGVLFASAVGAMQGFMVAALPFAAGVIMYVVIAQLLPVAQRARGGLAMFFGAAALFGLIERVIPHSH